MLVFGLLVPSCQLARILVEVVTPGANKRYALLAGINLSIVILPLTLPPTTPTKAVLVTEEDFKVRKPPVAKAPDVGVNKPVIFKVPPKTTPAVLLIVKFLMVFVAKTPEGIV